MANHLGFTGFLTRWLLAAALVFGTYNPSGFSFIGWVYSEGSEFGPTMAIVGLILLIGWIIVVKATFDSLGLLGVVLGGALFAAIVWWLVDIGLISMESTGVLTWLILVIISLILAAGMSWAHVKRRLTGQIEVDDAGD